MEILAIIFVVFIIIMILAVVIYVMNAKRTITIESETKAVTTERNAKDEVERIIVTESKSKAEVEMSEYDYTRFINANRLDRLEERERRAGIVFDPYEIPFAVMQDMIDEQLDKNEIVTNTTVLDYNDPKVREALENDDDEALDKMMDKKNTRTHTKAHRNVKVSSKVTFGESNK